MTGIIFYPIFLLFAILFYKKLPENKNNLLTGNFLLISSTTNTLLHLKAHL